MVLAALIALIAWGNPLAAQQVDVIRGQITGPDGAPIENANVTATSVQGGVNRTARSDNNGRFTITFPGGEGDYYVSVTSLGFAPRRFEVKRTADQDILVADTRMSRMVLLDTMRAVAERGRVNRNDKPADISGSEQSASAAAGECGPAGRPQRDGGVDPGCDARDGRRRRPRGLLRARVVG
jgi:hypothetical protein